MILQLRPLGSERAQLGVELLDLLVVGGVLRKLVVEPLLGGGDLLEPALDPAELLARRAAVTGGAGRRDRPRRVG